MNQMLAGIRKHAHDCADFAIGAIEEQSEGGFSPGVIEITRAAAREQISDDIRKYGTGEVKRKVLRLLTAQCCVGLWQ